MAYYITLFAFFAILLALSVVDARTQEIPPAFPIAIFVLGIISIWTMGNLSLLERIIGFFVVSLPMYLIVLLVPGGFGGGDIKLMAAAGFFLGWKITLISFLIALLLGGIYGALLLILQKKGRKDHFAFGPFLCIGMFVGFYRGEALLSWYLGIAQTLANGPGM